MATDGGVDRRLGTDLSATFCLACRRKILIPIPQVSVVIVSCGEIGPISAFRENDFGLQQNVRFTRG
jgi:hypothetical protein